MDEKTRVARAVVRDVARDRGRSTRLPRLSDDRLADPRIATEVVAAAAYHAILPLLWRVTERNPSVAPALRALVHDAYLPVVARGLRLQHLLLALTHSMAEAGLDYAVYKGPAMAAFYPRPELRAFSDIDVLVRREDLEAVDLALKHATFQGGWGGVPSGYAETNYQLDGFGAVDLHWELMREPSVRVAFDLDPTGMLSRCVRVSWSDVSFPVLDTADQLIAVATHACFDGAYRLGWLVDVALLIESSSLDWDEVIRRCAETGTSLPVQVILDRTRRALGIEAPVVLAGGAWRSAVMAVTVMRPAHRTFRQAGRGGIIYRSTRNSSATSFAAARSHIANEGLSPLIHDRNHRWKTPRNSRV